MPAVGVIMLVFVQIQMERANIHFKMHVLYVHVGYECALMAQGIVHTKDDCAMQNSRIRC